MKQKIFFIFLILGLNVQSQIISKQSISSYGGRLEAETYPVIIHDNLGEVIVGRMESEDGSIQIGNGFIPSLGIEILSISGIDNKFKAIVYPNPSSFDIQLYHPVIQRFSYGFFDHLGRIVMSGTVNAQEHINVALLASGTYLIVVESIDKKISHTVKLIKY
jgi:hypothetical protein